MDGPRFCTACGHRREERGSFCAGCGAPVPVTVDAAADRSGPVPGSSGGWDLPGGWDLDPPTGPITAVTAREVPSPRGRPAPSAHTGPAGGPWFPPGGGPAPGARSAVTAVTRGDWAGAAVAALSGVGATAVLAAASVLLLGAGDLPGVSAGDVVAMVAMLVAMAFGGSVTAGGSAGFGFVDGSVPATTVAGVEATPVLLTAVGLSVLASVYLRRLRARRATAVDALTQAVRVWAVLCGVLVVVGLVGRSTPDTTLVSSLRSGGSGPQIVVTTGFASTLFGAGVWLLLLLPTVLAWRMPWLLPARLRGWRDQVAGPAVGAVVTVVFGCVLLLAGSVTATLAQDAGTGSLTGPTGVNAGQVVGGLLLLAPTVVLGAFGFAAGVPLTVSFGTSAYGGASTGASRSLLDATDQSPQFWLAPLAVVVALLVGGMLAAVHAPTVEQARRRGWLMGAVLGVLLGVVAVATAVSAEGSALGVQAGGTAHLNYVLAPLAGLLWGALGGWVGALLAPGLPPGVLHGVRRHVLGARNRDDDGPLPLDGPAPQPAPGGSTP